MPFWLRANGGNWNGDPTANPATGTGGYSFGAAAGQLFVPFASLAPASLTANFGASSFTDTVPSGFTAGWPHAAGGHTTFDPSTLQAIGGSDGSLTGGNLTFTATNFTCGVTAPLADALRTGKFYWEFTVTSVSLFATNVGMGAMVVGAGYATFITSAQFSNANPNGGARMNSGSPSLGNPGNIYANNVQQTATFPPHLVAGMRFGVAVQLEGTNPQLAMDDLSVVTTPAGSSSNLIGLDWSDDRGHSYGSPVLQDIGARGRYETFCQWQRLGYGRDRVFRISWSVGMNTALMGAWIDISKAET
jgi:hypothetical protein